MLWITVISLFSASVSAGSHVRRNGLAPLVKSQGAVVPDSYIVKLNDGVAASSRDRILSSLAETSYHVYDYAFKGFAASMDATQLKQLRSHPNVSGSATRTTYSRITDSGRLITLNKTE